LDDVGGAAFGSQATGCGAGIGKPPRTEGPAKVAEAGTEGKEGVGRREGGRSDGGSEERVRGLVELAVLAVFFGRTLATFSRTSYMEAIVTCSERRHPLLLPADSRVFRTRAGALNQFLGTSSAKQRSNSREKPSMNMLEEPIIAFKVLPLLFAK
jgi:hypothetical protein